MNHVAILKWNFLDLILSGEKTIESRWYLNKITPWNNIKAGDVIYLKKTGKPVTAKVHVSKVVQYSDVTPEKVKELLDTYHKELGIQQDQIPDFFDRFKDKNYCIFIHLTKPQLITPFDIDKTGYGNMAAWLTVDNINEIIKK